jgi:hypothetical protein
MPSVPGCPLGHSVLKRVSSPVADGPLRPTVRRMTQIAVGCFSESSGSALRHHFIAIVEAPALFAERVNPGIRLVIGQMRPPPNRSTKHWRAPGL